MKMPKLEFKRPCLTALLLSATMASAAVPISGLDLSGFNPAVRAQDDLFRAANGAWLNQTEIPSDKSDYGTFIQLRDTSDQRVHAIVTELTGEPQRPGSAEHKIAAFYASYTDIDRIDRAGLEPARAMLAGIAAIKTRSDLARWLGQAQGQVRTPLALAVRPDFKAPGINLVLIRQGGLGLPDRDYYLKDDALLARARAAYLDYLTRLAMLAGENKPKEVARQVLALERRIAQAHWDKVDNRDPLKVYNPMSLAQLSSSAPGFDWDVFLAAAGLRDVDRISVSQPSATTGIARLYGEVGLAQWRNYLRLHLMDEAAEVLPKAVRQAQFAFRGTALTGATTQKPRWQRGVAAVNDALGEAVGQIYVARHFPPDYKVRMTALVSNLMLAFGDSIDGLSWMTATSKIAARDKLSKYTIKIGYPAHWRDYSQLELRAGDAFGNHMRAGRFEWQRRAAQAGKPVDRSEWGMTPQTVNAYYNPSLNEIVFPAAILQPPFFNMAADDAVNYGGIGAVIGHEISHGFDDQGSKFDGDGMLRNWWTDTDRAAFAAIGAQLVAQYEKYEPIAGKTLNGRLTLGENIADLSGLQIAYKAYLKSLDGKPATVLDGLTGQQRFFLGWAQIWRAKVRERRALQLLTVDPHSPAQFRANGAPVNHDGFHEAFQTKPGDAMYKPNHERLHIW